MNRPTRTLALWLTLVFLSGAAVGVLGYHLFRTRSAEAAGRRHLSPEEWRARYVETMRSRLNLTGEQLERLNRILDETREKFHRLDEELIKPRKSEIIKAQNEAIAAMLTDEQRAEYEKLRRERAERRRKAREQGEPPHPPRRGWR